MKRQRTPAEPVTPERIERALALCAYLVARDDDGRVYVPLMDRLESELMRARAEEDPVFRARRLLGACTSTRDMPSISIQHRG